MGRLTEVPNLYMMGGLPGAGKTTFASYAAGEIGAIHLNSVSMRRAMGLPLSPISETAARLRDDPLVFGAMDEAATAALRSGHDVFYDSSHNVLSVRDKGRLIAGRVGAMATLVWIDTPRAAAVERIRSRAENNMTSNPPLEVVQNYTLVTPGPNEPHITIDGCLPTEDQFTVFYQARLSGFRRES